MLAASRPLTGFGDMAAKVQYSCYVQLCKPQGFLIAAQSLAPLYIRQVAHSGRVQLSGKEMCIWRSPVLNMVTGDQ